MSKDLESAIQKISEGYRDITREIATISHEILTMSKELEDMNISHGKFMDLQNKKEKLNIKFIQMNLIADGVAQAREMVFSLMP